MTENNDHNTKRKRRVGLKFIIAVGIALIAMASTFLDGVANAGMAVDYPRWETSHTLRQLSQAIDNYHAETGQLPQQLGDVVAACQTDRDRDLITYYCKDSWENPIEYTTDGETYELVSYGRDGKPGGMGLDADRTRHNPRPREAYPTLSQILATHYADRIVGVTLISGAVALILGLVAAFSPPFTKNWHLLELTARIITTIIATCVFGAMLAMIHAVQRH
jgi:hypothetical protein